MVFSRDPTSQSNFDDGFSCGHHHSLIIPILSYSPPLLCFFFPILVFRGSRLLSFCCAFVDVRSAHALVLFSPSTVSLRLYLQINAR